MEPIDINVPTDPPRPFSSDILGLDAPPWELLARYTAEECAPAERAAVDAWIGASADRRAYVASLRAVYEATDRPHGGYDSRAAWAGFATRFGMSGELSPHYSDAAIHPKPSRPVPLPGSFPHRWSQGMGRGDRRVRAIQAVGVAAAIAILVMGGVAAWGVTRMGPGQQVRELTSAAGSRATVTLRDGTRLVLAPATHLRVPATFGRRDRTLELDGEALIAVVHDPGHPFTIRTRRAEIRDIGTTFVVRAYADDAEDRVVVTEGQLSLTAGRGGARADRAGAPLSAGDVATIADTAITVVHGAKVDTYTAWAQGRLVFDSTPLGAAVRELARTFDLQVTIADSSLAGERVTGTFDNLAVDEVLNEVTWVVGARFERHGRTVVIHRRGGQPARGGPAPSLSTALAHPPSA